MSEQMIQKSFSQIGQDIWVAEKIFSFKRGGYFADIGAYDGVNFSNTYSLEKYYDWSGVCVEAAPGAYAKLVQNRTAAVVRNIVDVEKRTVDFLDDGGMLSRPFDGRPKKFFERLRYQKDLKKHLQAVVDAGKPGKIIQERTRTLEDIFKSVKSPKHIDYLSLDIEGFERRILEKFPYNRYSFGCISAELKIFNTKERQTFIDMMDRNGYAIDACFFTDIFFVNKNMNLVGAGQEWFDCELAKRIDSSYLQKPEMAHIPWVIKKIYGEDSKHSQVLKVFQAEHPGVNPSSEQFWKIFNEI